MKLYHKNLTSLAALRREKATLIRVANAVEQHNPNIDMDDMADSAIDFFRSEGLKEKLLSLSVPILGFLERKVERETLKLLIKKVFTGYLKWKLLEKGIEYLISTLRKKG